MVMNVFPLSGTVSGLHSVFSRHEDVMDGVVSFSPFSQVFDRLLILFRKVDERRPKLLGASPFTAHKDVDCAPPALSSR